MSWVLGAMEIAGIASITYSMPLSGESRPNVRMVVGQGAIPRSGDSGQPCPSTAPMTAKRTPFTNLIVYGGTTGLFEAAYKTFAEVTGTSYTDLWLMLGDNAYNSGTDAEYQSKLFAEAGEDGDAFTFAERSKARTLLDTLYSGRASLRTRLSPEERKDVPSMPGSLAESLDALRFFFRELIFLLHAADHVVALESLPHHGDERHETNQLIDEFAGMATAKP